MKRYVIIAAAFIIGLVVMSLLTRLLKDKGAAHPLFQYRAIVSAAVGLVCFVGLSLLLEYNAADIDTRYQPAFVKDGQINSGQFSK